MKTHNNLPVNGEPDGKSEMLLPDQAKRIHSLQG